MLRKLFVFTLILTAGYTAAIAQDAPVAPEKRAQRTITIAPFESSYLGVQTQEITKENFSKYGLAAVRGVGIEKVVENSPAAKAGLQDGDVIVQFEGEEVTSTRKLTRLISEVAPDHAAKVIILRGGSEREINVTLGKRELPKFENGNFQFRDLQSIAPLPNLSELPRTMQAIPFPPNAGDGNFFVFRGGASRQIGVGVAPLTKQLGDYFGIADGGLLINNVRENSPAAKAGLKAGDVIIEADGKAVKEMSDLVRALSEKKEGDVTLTIVRDKTRQIVRVTPEASKDGTMKLEDLEKFKEINPNQMNFHFQTPPVSKS